LTRPTGPTAQWRREAESALSATSTAQPLVAEADLGALPAPLAAYVQGSGAVGQPRTVNFVARVSGRIRGGPNKRWMSFSGQQVNMYGDNPQRFLLMKARMFGLPVVVTHLFDRSSASMHARLFSLITVMKSAGPDMDRAETVTLFNDLVVMAPAAIPYASVRWTTLDDRHVRGSFTKGSQTVTAELEFNQRHELVNFVSDDRLRASQDGKSFTRLRWSTPIRQYSDMHGRKVASLGEAQWYAAEPEGRFMYLDFHVDDIQYNLGSQIVASRRHHE
jgi:hypothetical protein